MPADRMEYTPAGYGADYMRNLRWRYRTYYGAGTGTEPYRGGGSFGRGYRRAGDLGARAAYPGPPPRRGYAAPYYDRHPGGYRHPRGRPRRRAEPLRGPGAGYPYFRSSAIVEAVQGYPPADTLNPEVYPPALGWGVGDYGEEYEPPGVVAERWRRPHPRARGRAEAPRPGRTSRKAEEYGRGRRRSRGRRRG